MILLQPASVALGMHDQHNREDYDVPRSNRGSLGATASKRPSQGSLQIPGSGSSSHLFYDTPPNSNRASGENEGIYDTPPSSKRASSERTPPPSNRSSASRDSAGSGYLMPGLALSQSQQSINQLNALGVFSLNDVRRRSGSRGSDNCYETPPGSNRSSNRSSLERILSEEGPPIYETLSPSSSLEQIVQEQDEDATYDTPPSRSHALSNVNPSSQTSLHSTASNESLLSTASGVSNSRLSNAASLPDSARSSMDLPTETYDVPPQSQNLDRSRKQLSMDSGLGFYDSPTKSRPVSSSSSTVPSHPEGSASSSKSPANCISPAPKKDLKRSRSVENALDDVYDTPKNNTPKNGSKMSSKSASFGSSSAINDSSSVYDVPPQVTRDSVISNRSDSSDESIRLSSSSFELDMNKMGLPLWDELLLDYDSALEVLTKRQQDVSKATSRLSSFVTPTWRTRASLEKTLYDIKVSCSRVQNCLGEFVDFAQGTIANASKFPDRQLANRLYKHVSPLQNTLDLINKSFASLEEMKWQVALLSEPIDKTKSDDLGQIALVSKDLMADVKRIASFIQSNSQHLFKKASIVDAKKSVSSKPPMVPKAGDWNGGKVGNGYGYAKVKSVQQRPLPAVPIPDKRIPASAATIHSSTALSSGKGEYGLENLPKSMYAIKEALHKDDYAECGDLFEKRMESVSHGDDMEQNGQEYDYVQLDDNDTLTRSRSRTDKGQTTQNVDESDGKKENSEENQNNPKAPDTIQYESKKIDNDDDIDIKTSELSLEDKDVDDKPIDTKPELKDDDVDMVPVKESSILERPNDNTKSLIPEEVDTSSNQNDLTKTDNSSDSIPGIDQEEQDQRTPVNINSIDISNFPLPEISTPTTTAEGSVDEPVEAEQLDPNDHQVLVHYAEQMNSHSTLLANAIDAFIGVVGANQPPNIFISHSKFVIVSAHKLVHIGDTIHRNLASNAISARVMHSANHLCDCLKASVNATKVAALQFPSQVAVQEMVDKVIAVSHAAHQLKFIITQAHRQ